eukprot:15365137-Ditylum_brightwellii.AAC.1
MDIQFRKGCKWLNHSSRVLHLAELVSITFHLKKREKERGEAITMHRTRDSQLNPIIHWSYLVRRVQKIPDFEGSWLIDTIARNGTVTRIRAAKICLLIRSSVIAVGEDKLGFKASEVSTHSHCSGTVIAMYLAGVPVQEFLSGMSSKIVVNPGFYTVLNEIARVEDPRVAGNPDNFATRFFGTSYCDQEIRFIPDSWGGVGSLKWQ